MASEHESAVEAWLENEDTQAEMAVIHKRFPSWTSFQVVVFAAAMEILVHLEMPTMTVVEGDAPQPDEKPEWMDDDDEEEEKWRGR